MASPQLEQGHVRIANEVLEHLVQAGLSGTEWALVMVVIRETWGWRRKVAPISQSTFARALGREVLAYCHRLTLRRLCEKQILISTPGTGKNSVKWQVNKDWEKWIDPAPTGAGKNGSYPAPGSAPYPAPTGADTLHLQEHSKVHLQEQTSKTVKYSNTKTIKNS